MKISIEALTAHSAISAQGCWLWQRAKNKEGGYGVVWSEGKMQMVHRLMYELAHGEIPPGMQICHRCDVPACFNPGHLFLGTAKDNAQDALRKGRLVIPLFSPLRKKFCKKGHPLEGKNLRIHKGKGNKRRCRQCDNEARAARRIHNIPSMQPVEPAKV